MLNWPTHNQDSWEKLLVSLTHDAARSEQRGELMLGDRQNQDFRSMEARRLGTLGG